MSERILRLPQVIDACGISRSTIYAYVDEGKFPAPMKLGPRSIGWPQSAIAKWMAERQSDDVAPGLVLPEDRDACFRLGYLHGKLDSTHRVVQGRTRASDPQVTIEQGVPLPVKGPRFPFNEMQVGDSFVLTAENQKELTRLRGSLTFSHHYWKTRHGLPPEHRISVRVQPDSSLRVWRIA